MKQCIKCKKVKPIEDFYTKKKVAGGKSYPTSYCKECDKIRTSDSYANNKKERKTTAIEYKGGKCVRCGYSKCLSALEFHHRDRTTKDPKFFHYSRRLLTEAVKTELDKCDLVCANCHREIHEEEGTNGRSRKEILG